MKKGILLGLMVCTLTLAACSGNNEDAAVQDVNEPVVEEAADVHEEAEVVNEAETDEVVEEEVVEVTPSDIVRAIGEAFKTSDLYSETYENGFEYTHEYITDVREFGLYGIEENYSKGLTHGALCRVYPPFSDKESPRYFFDVYQFEPDSEDLISAKENGTFTLYYYSNMDALLEEADYEGPNINTANAEVAGNEINVDIVSGNYALDIRWLDINGNETDWHENAEAFQPMIDAFNSLTAE